MLNFIIPNQTSGQRLDKFLVDKLTRQTRSQIQKLIKSGAVLVNNKRPTIHQFLKKNDVVSISQERTTTLKHANYKHSGLHQSPIFKKVSAPNIITNQPDYLVVNKPAGLLVHPAPDRTETALTNILQKKYPSIKKASEDPLRPGIVHRLDRAVSGLLVVAKNQAMFHHLKDQFKMRRIKKEYIALVYGAPQKLEGEIKFNIDRSDTTDYKMAAVPEHEDRGRSAITKFELLETHGNYSLLRLFPTTGRTHQIRVHLNAYRLPIVGDVIYKPKKLKNKIKLGRIFLHAERLGFHDLTGVWQEYEAPLPSELQTILNNLKK